MSGRAWVVASFLAVACAGAITFVVLDRNSSSSKPSTNSSSETGRVEAVSSRSATRAERSAILDADRAYLRLTRPMSKCIDYEIAVSEPGAEYAMVAYGFHIHRAGCEGVAFNGQTLFRREGGKWKFRAAASEWNCSAAPKGVVASLTRRLGVQASCVPTN